MSLHDVKEKYQKTKIGVIPKDWKTKKITEIAKVNAENLNNKTPDSYEFYYYDLSSIDKGKISHPNEKITYGQAPSRAKRRFQKNDVLMSTVRPNLQGFGYVDFDADNCVCSTGFAVISGEHKSDSLYIYHNLYSNAITNQINKLIVGSNYPAITARDVENMQIPFPSDINERKKISSMLSTWDKAIELKEKLIDQKKEQKKGLMQKLLMGHIRMNDRENSSKEEVKERLRLIEQGEVPDGYKKTKIGILPIDWSLIKAKDIFKNHSNKSHDGELEVLSATQDRGIVPRNQLDIDIKYDESSLSNYKKVEQGDFVISLRSFQGGIEYSNYEGLVSPAYTVLKNKKEISVHFYRFLFKKEDFISRLNSVIYGIRDGKQISYKDFGELYIQYPSQNEQRKISEILLAADREIEIRQKELDLLRQQKTGLMQKLLTGKVRVQV